MYDLFATQLDLEVPKDFLVRLGCKTVTNFVGFYFDDTDNYAIYDNGVTEDKVDRQLWECWRRKPQVATVFEDIDRLWKNCGESHGLILKIDASTFFRANTSVIIDFLYQTYIETNRLPDL